jgi:16S rRNA (cytosine967-C5)-methyltransferase
MKPFRRTHLLQLLHEWKEGPLDGMARHYFRTHKAIGSKDRAIICNTLYGMVRWRGFLDYLSDKPYSWERRLDIYLKISPLDYLSKEEIPLHIRLSFPKFIFEKLKQAYGTKKTVDFCLTSNQIAPTTIRVNVSKISRDALLKKWEGVYKAIPCSKSPCGIQFEEKINLFALPEFKAGLFEVQDEGSQLVADHVEATGKDHVLDYCAGSGGKTLAFAHKMKQKGQIYLFDTREQILLQAKKRLKRSGIQNAQIVDLKKLKKQGFQKKFNWILLDVPCSGSGTLRRNPDMKWHWSKESIKNLLQEQREIFEASLKFLHPKGKIVYATCSVFPWENEEQISHFMQKYGMKLEKPPFFSFPQKDGMDGFFCGILVLC